MTGYAAGYGTAQADTIESDVLIEYERMIEDEEAAIKRLERLAARIGVEIASAKARREAAQRTYDLVYAALRKTEASE